MSSSKMISIVPPSLALVAAASITERARGAQHGAAAEIVPRVEKADPQKHDQENRHENDQQNDGRLNDPTKLERDRHEPRDREALDGVGHRERKSDVHPRFHRR